MHRCGGGGAPVQGGQELPREAEVVVVGGGVAGTGVAYHLATRGAGRGVLLLEVGWRWRWAGAGVTLPIWRSTPSCLGLLSSWCW